MTPSVPLAEIVDYADSRLQNSSVRDWSNALNGLQLENGGRVSRLAAAVDASGVTIQKAIEAGADLLLVHHGLFWSGLQPITGPVYRRIGAAIDAGLAIYSSHLPLDLHPELGNNSLLFLALGLKNPEPFFEEKGAFIGLATRTALPLQELTLRFESAVGGPVKCIAGGPSVTRRIGVVTGGAGGSIQKAAAEGADTFLTGEAPHWAYTAAEDLGINLLLGGHYATETFGVRALAEELSGHFSLPWSFIDHPTGL